jgi:hypothetical protein
LHTCEVLGKPPGLDVEPREQGGSVDYREESRFLASETHKVAQKAKRLSQLGVVVGH